MTETKFIIISKNRKVKLTRGVDNFWHDEQGTIWALSEGATADKVKRCGVWPFALPTWKIFQPINEACLPHDFCYDTPVYQAFHTEVEADDMLENLQSINGHPLIGELFEEISKRAGVPYWENEETRRPEIKGDPVDSGEGII